MTDYSLPIWKKNKFMADAVSVWIGTVQLIVQGSIQWVSEVQITSEYSCLSLNMVTGRNWRRQGFTEWVYGCGAKSHCWKSSPACSPVLAPPIESIETSAQCERQSKSTLWLPVASYIKYYRTADLCLHFVAFDSGLSLSIYCNQIMN